MSKIRHFWAKKVKFHAKITRNWKQICPIRNFFLCLSAKVCIEGFHNFSKDNSYDVKLNMSNFGGK